MRRHKIQVLSALALLLAFILSTPPASAATGLNIFVGYMDTHTVGSSSKQPSPWPYKDPTSYVGSPCANYPTSTTCWDSSAVRLVNPGGTDITGVHVVVLIGSKTYNLWGSSLTVKANGTLVLTETGAQNSENFDGSDYPPNAYNGGNTASCANSGAIPLVRVTVGGTTTDYRDTGQVLNGGGVDSGHCLNGKFVSGRMDESHPWVQIGSSAATAPSAPQSLAATAGSGSATLSWSVPASNGGAAITGYNVYRGTAPGGESATPVASNVTTTSFTDTGLTNGTTYYYTVAAVNSVGTSPRSNEASATPRAVQATVPSAPLGVAAAPGSQSMTVTWSAPSSDGGSPVTGYNVYRGTTAGGEAPTPVASNVTGTRFTDSGLTNGTTYYYKVAAVNAVGVGAQSAEASAAPRASAPSAPRTLVASGGNGSVALSWATPTSDGGAGITGYNVYRGTTAGGEATTPVATNVSTTSYTDTGTTNGTTYYYKVAAVNSAGTSPQSNEASATPQQAATAPTAPQGLTAAASNGAVQLSWTAPTSNGGAAITGYNVYRGTTAGGEATTPVASNVTTTSYTDTSTTNGTTYFYKVAAVNAVGTSPPSGEVSATPKAGAPTAPLSLTASPGDGSVGLSWSVPASNGGTAITGYNVYRGTAAGGESTTPVASNVTTTSFTDTGLANGTAYFYRVAAVNSAGTSPQSNEATATPQPVGSAGYAGRVGSLTASTSRTTSTVTVGSAGVAAGHTLVATLLLSSTTSVTGSLTVKDTAGNTYTAARDVNDGSAGDRTVTLVAVNVHQLAAGSTITFTYPSSGETHLSVDEFSGVTGIDTSAGATGTGTSFSSGSTSATSQAQEILVGDVGAESASKPTFAAGWTALPVLAISSDYLDTAYRLVTATGSFAATGTSGGQWMAAVVALRTN
ncbi:MAG: fibronectin type III domain-containing protein [Nocardioidaceae bacterium]